MRNIFEQIRAERKDFLVNEVEIVPGYTFSQYNTVKKIHLYYNSHYVDGDYENVNGVQKKKFFHNITQWRCDVATKMLDVDVKDFVLVGNDPAQDVNVHLLEKELKAWMKKHELGQKLNEIVRKLPVYGSVVLKKHNKGVQLVDLRHLYIDQSADSLKDARYINIKNFMTPKELRDMKGKWDNVEEAIERFSRKQKKGYDEQQSIQTGGSSYYADGSSSGVDTPEGTPFVEVWERYGECPKSWITNKDSDENDWVLCRYVVCGVDDVSKNNNRVIMNENGIVLYYEEISELPLKEVHYQKTEGRWLGIGVVEATFEAQRRINEIKNQESHAMEVGSKIIFQSRDDTVASNVTTDMDNGDILTVKSEITPIATELRDLKSFVEASKSVDELADRLTFSYDVVRGEASPSGTTLGAVQIQQQQAGSVFDYKRENIGLFLGEYIKDIVYPQLRKELNKAHILRYVGSMEEMERLRNNFATHLANEEIIGKVLDGQILLPGEQEEIMQKYIKQLSTNAGDHAWVEVMDKFFEGIDYEVELVITGENKNLYAQIANSQGMLSLLSDPTLMQDPVRRAIFLEMLSSLGMRSSHIEDLANKAQQAQQQQMMEQQQAQQAQMMSPTTQVGQPNQPAQPMMGVKPQ